MSDIGFAGGSECAYGLCYCCGVNAARKSDCPICPPDDIGFVARGETMCPECRGLVLAECQPGCGATYFEIGEFRELPLDQVFTLDRSIKLEVRVCDGRGNDLGYCGELLGIRISRDGKPIPAALAGTD